MAIGQHLSDKNPDGSSFGQSTTDLITFYGGTPVAQRANSSQAAFVATTTATATTTLLEADVLELGVLVNEIRAVLVGLNLMKGSA